MLLSCLLRKSSTLSLGSDKSIDRTVVDRVVLSAYIMQLNSSLAFGKSLMYIMKSSGPRIEPCDTPVVMLSVPDFASLISMYCLRLFRYLLNKFNAMSLIPE